MKKQRELRVLNIAAMILYRYCGDVSITTPDNNLIDLIIKDNTSEMEFGVNVKSSSFLENLEYEDYVSNMIKIPLDKEKYRKPILLMLVNEKQETAKLGFQVAWLQGKAYIFKKVSLQTANEKNVAKILDYMKSMDDTIRVLSKYGIKVIKTIAFKFLGSDEQRHSAQVVYLRDFTNQYKMNCKQVVDDKERFKRLLEGIPEEEYPQDALDNLICEAISSQVHFEDVQCTSKVLLCSNELRDFQSWKAKDRKNIQIKVEPDLTQLPQRVLSVVNSVVIRSFYVTCFFNDRTACQAFGETNLTLTKPLEEWKVWESDYKRLKGTLHKPSELWVIG